MSGRCDVRRRGRRATCVLADGSPRHDARLARHDPAAARPRGASGPRRGRSAQPRRWQERAMAMTAAVKDELAAPDGHEAVLPQGRDRRRCSDSPAACTSSAATSSIEAELDTGAAARRLRKDIAEVFGHGSEVRGAGGRRAAQGQPLPRPGRHGRRGAGPADRAGRRPRPAGPRPAAAGRRRRDVRRRGRLARRVPRARLADRARPLLARWRSPAPARRRRWPWSARPGGSGIPAKAREVRGVDRVVIRDGDAIGALLTRLGAHDSRAGLGGAPDAPRGPGHRQPAGQLRRRQPAPLGAGRGRRGRPGRARAGDPRRRRPRPPARRPAGCASSTSRPAWRSSASSPTRR